MIEKETIIEIEGLKKYYKEVKAVDNISLKIYKGQFTALLGPNGAGKTTTMEMIEGITQPDSGEIRIKGMRWKEHKEELHHLIGLSLQETRFIDKLTVKETLELFSSFYKLEKARVDEVLEIINLEQKQKSYVVNLSGGQRQRLSLGISLLNKPEILLLDEPTTGLDPTARREIWEVLRDLKQFHNTSMVLTTHYMEEAESLCERIIIMDKGKILAESSLDKLLKEYATGEIIDYSLGIQCKKPTIEGIKGIISSDYDAENNKGRIIVEDAVQFLPDFFKSMQQQNLELKGIESRKRTLDDLFISITGRHLSE